MGLIMSQNINILIKTLLVLLLIPTVSAIENGSYTLNGSHVYYTTVSENITVVNNTNITVLVLHPIYNLTIKARDSTTNAWITTFTAFINGVGTNSINGSVIYQVDYSMQTVSVQATGYNNLQKTFLVPSDKTEIFDLTPLQPYVDNHVIYDPLHPVQFVVCGYFCLSKYPNVNVTITDPLGGMQNGTTDTYAAVVFWVNSTIRYSVRVLNTSQGLDYTVYVYPITTPWYIIVPFGSIDWHSVTGGYDQNEQIDVKVTTSIINATHGYINISYNNSLADTTQVIFDINQSSGLNQTNVQSSDGGAVSSYSKSFIVLNSACTGYFANIYSTDTTFGSNKYNYGISFPGMCQSTGINTTILFYFGLALLIFVGGMAGATSHIQVSGVVVVLGWILQGWGWIAGAGVNVVGGLTIATIIIALAMINERAKVEGLT